MQYLIPAAIVIALTGFAPSAWANKSSATSEIAEARAMVRSAERSGADSMATVELKTARNRLNSAQVSLEARDWDNAEYAAKKSQRDAELADAKTQALKAEAALAELEAKQTERGLLITLGDVLFELNKSDLRAGSERNLLPLANVLKERPDQTLIIEGHTDSTGSPDYNMALSEKRAQSVAQYLVQQGVDSDVITTTGLGPDFPVASNANSEGR